MPPAHPATSCADGPALGWSAPAGEVFWYRIYRSQQPDFQPGPETFLTYVDKGTTRFRDASEDFAGRKCQGDWYYRIMRREQRRLGKSAHRRGPRIERRPLLPPGEG